MHGGSFVKSVCWKTPGLLNIKSCNDLEVAASRTRFTRPRYGLMWLSTSVFRRRSRSVTGRLLSWDSIMNSPDGGPKEVEKG